MAVQIKLTEASGRARCRHCQETITGNELQVTASGTGTPGAPTSSA